ncbi:MAG: aromatic ring-hydroxylating dioxygenase subunit alpha, partial [Anaerolineales bacterium]|nr:aromatic ring-hydroxylating dioxygenase subunit alpha [Anaerolineales bacterium]
MLNDPVLLNDWHAVAPVEQVKSQVMLATQILGEDLVLWYADGEIMAWQDLCIHRGTRLSLGEVRDNTLHCPYHGWVYNASGQCVHIPAHPEQAPPAKARVKSYACTVAYDLVWVCLGEPTQAPPPFPEWELADYRKLLCGPYRVPASGPRIIENFLDIAHFPFVHEGILGVKDRPEIAD